MELNLKDTRLDAFFVSKSLQKCARCLVARHSIELTALRPVDAVHKPHSTYLKDTVASVGLQWNEHGLEGGQGCALRSWPYPNATLFLTAINRTHYCCCFYYDCTSSLVQFLFNVCNLFRPVSIMF
jgi:hypothetical protein